MPLIWISSTFVKGRAIDLIEDDYLDMKITQKSMREEMQSIERELQI